MHISLYHLDLTLFCHKCIMFLMKRIGTRKNSFLKRLLINIPFVLIVALIAACFFAGGTLIFYCVVTAVAFHSAMISLVTLGAGFILVGAGLGLIIAFRRYHDFYDKQMGWEYPDRKDKDESVDKPVTEVSSQKPLKSYFSLSNISLAILAVGAVFTIISAALGCINRDNWLAAVGPYREARGYYADVKLVNYPVFIEDSATHSYIVDTVELELLTKEAVIVYTDDSDKLGKITAKAYLSYEHQVDFYLSGRTYRVVENPAPEPVNDALDKLLFFADDVLKSVSSEKQIVIYVPYALKGKLEIKGNYIEAK